MAKRQTRACTSVKAQTYARILLYCEQQGITVSGFVEALVAEELDKRGVPMVKPEDLVVRPRKIDPPPSMIGGGIHEF